jgi:NADPH2:quinone reductase
MSFALNFLALPLFRALLIGHQRFGETERRNPAENVEIWKGLRKMIENGLIKPTIYDKQYIGLESVVDAMSDLSERKVWGKAVIRIKHDGRPRL